MFEKKLPKDILLIILHLLKNEDLAFKNLFLVNKYMNSFLIKQGDELNILAPIHYTFRKYNLTKLKNEERLIPFKKSLHKIINERNSEITVKVEESKEKLLSFKKTLLKYNDAKYDKVQALIILIDATNEKPKPNKYIKNELRNRTVCNSIGLFFLVGYLINLYFSSVATAKSGAKCRELMDNINAACFGSGLDDVGCNFFASNSVCSKADAVNDFFDARDTYNGNQAWLAFACIFLIGHILSCIIVRGSQARDFAGNRDSYGDFPVQFLNDDQSDLFRLIKRDFRTEFESYKPKTIKELRDFLKDLYDNQSSSNSLVNECNQCLTIVEAYQKPENNSFYTQSKILAKQNFFHNIEVFFKKTSDYKPEIFNSEKKSQDFILEIDEMKPLLQ